MNIYPGDEAAPLVLIIDDSRAVRQYVSELLANAGYRVITATDGLSGIELVKAESPDAVLLDIEMPDMSGLEVLDMLNRQQRLYSVLMLTTRSDIEDRIKGLNRGADDYITKPFQPDELLARVLAAARNAALKKELHLARETTIAALRKLHEVHDRIVEEQKSVTLSRFAAGVAHEINNPLGYVMSDLNTFLKYTHVLFEGLDRLAKIHDMFQVMDGSVWESVDATVTWANKSKIDFMRADIVPLVSQIMEGFDRISSAVKCINEKPDKVVERELDLI